MQDAAAAVMALGFFGTVTVAIRSITTLWGKRIDARRVEGPAEGIDQRLARIEAAVDVIAIEVERIAEAQRFAAQLDAARDARRIGGASSAGEGRVITPH